MGDFLHNPRMLGFSDSNSRLQNTSFDPSYEVENFLRRHHCQGLSIEPNCGAWTATSGAIEDGKYLLCAPTEAFVMRVEPIRGKTLYVLPLDSSSPMFQNGYEIPAQSFGFSSTNDPLVLHSKGTPAFLLAWISHPRSPVANFPGPLVIHNGPSEKILPLNSNAEETDSQIGGIIKKLTDAASKALDEDSPDAFQKSPLRLRNRITLVESLWNHFAARIDSDMDLPAIANRNGISQRTLEYAFQEIVGSTPVAFIKTLRLHRARRLILNGEVRAVKDAAAQCGMWHFGRFSIEYRAQFGRHPRIDLKNVKLPQAQAQAA